MSRPSLQLRIAHSAPIRYALAILSVSIASGFALLADHFRVHDVAVPICLIGIAVTAWYAGPGPALLAVVISVTFFDYFFVEPRYSLITTVADLPYFIIFIAFASLVAWFSGVRRRVERDLRNARDKPEIEVAERTQQANPLNLTSDMIFVRDMDDLITYWNRGAQQKLGIFWAVINQPPPGSVRK